MQFILRCLMGLGRSGAALLVLGALLAIRSPAEASEVKLFASVAMKPALDDLMPRFQALSGHTVRIDYGVTPGILKKIEAGAPFDVLILPVATVETLIGTGQLRPDPRPVVGVAVASLAYRAGATPPDTSSPEALKAALLAAGAISLSDPALGGASSNYFMGLIRRLGIEVALADKLVLTRPGDGAVPVAGGQTRYGAALTSEIAGTPGAAGVPLSPGDPAGITTLVAAASSHAAQADAARALIAYLDTPDGHAARRAHGLGE